MAEDKYLETITAITNPTPITISLLVSYSGQLIPTVLTTASSNIDETSFTSGGEVLTDGGETITERGVVYSTNPNPTVLDNKIISGSGLGAFVSEIIGLDVDTTYYVRAYATNSLITVYGNEVETATVSAQLGYGRLYNWYAASDANFAPTDWKVPEQSDYLALKSILGANIAGRLKERGTLHWSDPNVIADPDSGFNALGGGMRGFDGSFIQFKDYGTYWLNSEGTPDDAYYYRQYAGSFTEINFNNLRQESGASVKLLYTGVGAPTSVTDIDGNVYDVVQIGTQYWTVQNWKCTKLNNGISIPNVTDNTEWANLGSGTGIDYQYGNLYNWHTVEGANGDNLILGLRVPDYLNDTQTLNTYLGGYLIAGGKLKEAGTNNWTSPNTGAVLDEFGFSMLPGGQRFSAYININNDGRFWTSRPDNNNAFVNWFRYNSDALISSPYAKYSGNSIRLMRDLTAPELLLNDGDVIESVYDEDGNGYGLIKIGTQGWMNQNLRTTSYIGGTSIPTGFNSFQWQALTTAGYCIYDDGTLDNALGMCAYGNDPGNV